MNRILTTSALLAASVALMGANESGCSPPPSSNDIQRNQQERILQEGNSEVGMPAVTNFREKKELKTIYEMRDQADLVTYTYLWNPFGEKLIFFCQSIGYPIPYSTQFTAPESAQRYVVQDADGGWAYGTQRLPQADPNGLFSPASAEGTWVLCKDPKSPDIKPIYVEPRVIASPFKMDVTK